MQQANPDQFCKIAVKAGVYTQSWIDPKTGEIHQEVAYISPEYLRESAWSTTEMMKRRLDVPVCLDHKDEAYPKPIEQWLEDEMRTAVGKLISVKYNPVEDAHEYTFSVNDPEIAKKIKDGTITKVSPNFHSSFEPGDGTIWKNIVRHLALTFRPKDFHQSSAPMARITSLAGTGHGQTRFSVVASRPVAHIKLVPMHKLSFSVLRSLAKKDVSGKITFASVDHKFRFDNQAKFDAWLTKRYQGELRMSVTRKLGHVLYFAVIHAPIGGVTINGRKYLGGQFIPNEHVEGLPEADRNRIKESAASSQRRRAEHAAKFSNEGEGHGDAIARHAGEHANAEMSPEDKKAASRRWASLRAHHGADALQRVTALAGTEAARLAKLDPASDKAKHLARRLRAYHEMAQMAGKNQPDDIGKYEITTSNYDGKTQHIFKKNGKELGEISTIKRDDGADEVSNLMVWPEHQKKGHATNFYAHAANESAKKGNKLFVSNDLTDDARAVHGKMMAKGQLLPDGSVKPNAPLQEGAGHADAMREMAEASKDADDATAAKIKKERAERVTAKIASEIDYHGGWEMLTPEQKSEIESDVNALDKDDEKAEAVIVDKAENYAIDGKWENNKKVAEENEKKREEAEKSMLSNHGMLKSGMSLTVDPASLDKAKAFVTKLREGADSHEKSLDPKKHSQEQIKRAMKDIKKTRKDADQYEKQIKDHEHSAMPVPEDIKPKASVEANDNPLHAEMRKLHDEIQHHEKAARDMQPKNGAIGIGGADFDHTLKRSVAEGYLFALNKGASPEEAHKAAVEAGRHSVKMWNERGSKGRASINSSHELKCWANSGDDYADTIHRRFAKIGNPQETKASSGESYKAEEDKEGNIRGVATLPDGRKIVGKWREKAWSGQDGEKEMHERLKRDVIVKHSYDLDKESSGARDSADFDSRTKGHNDAKKQVLKALYPLPKDRPEVLAEYPEASGYTRKYRVEHASAGEGNVAYQPVYDRFDESGKLIDSNKYGSPHESYDNAAREIGVHTHYLSRNGHGDQPVLHDPITKAEHESSKKRLEDAHAEDARKKEEYESGETAKAQANNSARAKLQGMIKSTKGKRGSALINFDEGRNPVKVTGAQHGNFLVHKAVYGNGEAGEGYNVTHIPTGVAAAQKLSSQGSGIELAHLLEHAGDWSGKNLPSELLHHGAHISRKHASGDYSGAMERAEQAQKMTVDSKKKDKQYAMNVVHAPEGGVTVDGTHYLGGQFTPGGVEHKGKSASVQERQAYMTRADAHTRALKPKQVVANLPHVGKVTGLQHGNLMVHKSGDKHVITHMYSGKKVGEDSHRSDALRKAYLLHHGLEWHESAGDDPKHKARHEDVSGGVMPRDLPIDGLRSDGDLPGNDHDKAVNEAVKKHADEWVKFEPNYMKMKDEYLKRNATFDEAGNLKSVAVNTDDWRDFIPGYVGTNSAAVHEAASYANDKLLKELITDMKGKGNGKIAILGGGGGSGKGTAVGNHFDEREYPIRIDQTSSDYARLSKKIDEIKSHGYEPDIVFIDRNPQDAWKGVVGRAMSMLKKGANPRTVPAPVAVQANIDARRAALTLAKERPDIKLRVIDNNGGPQDSKLLKSREEIINHLSAKEYNADEEKKGALKHVEELEKEGHIPTRVAKGLRGA